MSLLLRNVIVAYGVAVLAAGIVTSAMQFQQVRNDTLNRMDAELVLVVVVNSLFSAGFACFWLLPAIVSYQWVTHFNAQPRWVATLTYLFWLTPFLLFALWSIARWVNTGNLIGDKAMSIVGAGILGSYLVLWLSNRSGCVTDGSRSSST